MTDREGIAPEVEFGAARSSTVRRRPPLGDGVNSGISRSSATHNLSLILRLAMP
jgi:hypothetical protein